MTLSDPKFSAALDKCRSLMPNGGPMNQSFDVAAQDKILQLVKCMREHGVTVPDPQFDANGKVVLSGGMPQINPSDPKFASAIQACRQYLPSGLPGASGTP